MSTISQVVESLEKHYKSDWVKLGSMFNKVIDICNTKKITKPDSIKNLDGENKVFINRVCDRFNDWKCAKKWQLISLIPEINHVMRACDHCLKLIRRDYISEVTLMHTNGELTHFICCNCMNICREISISNSVLIINWYLQLCITDKKNYCNELINKHWQTYINRKTNRETEIQLRQCAMKILSNYIYFILAA